MNTTGDISKLPPNHVKPLVEFVPNITKNHAITNTNFSSNIEDWQTVCFFFLSDMNYLFVIVFYKLKQTFFY